MPIVSRNPATTEILQTFDAHAPDEIERRLQRAADMYVLHRSTTFSERAERMHAAADILEDEKQQLGRLMTLEMGKPIAAAVAEAEKCAWACRYYADHAERFLADERINTGERESFVRHQPIGVVLAIMPWNFPFWQVFRFIAPNIMAGNVGLLKHASNVPQCALAIEDVMRRAGFEEGVFQTLLVESPAVDGLIRDPRVRAVTLTGSDAAGAAVAKTAGECLKKTVLELGGSDPFIVMASADVDTAVTTAVTARTINNGQSCIAAKRFIVEDTIYERFTNAFVERMRELRVGDPLDDTTQIGPLATKGIRDELARQVEDSVAAGARILTGGRVMENNGWFYEPTVLENIPRESPAWRDEMFGPVAALFRVGDVEEAIRLANESIYGLGSSAWTLDENQRRRFIEELDAGMVFINGMVASDPRLPFGGVKRSGYGRELGKAGILEFVNIKSVVVEGEASGEIAATE